MTFKFSVITLPFVKNKKDENQRVALEMVLLVLVAGTEEKKWLGNQMDKKKVFM